MVHELQMKDLTLGQASVVFKEEKSPWGQDYPSDGCWGNPTAVVKEGSDVGAGEVRVEGLENTQVLSLTLEKRGQKVSESSFFHRVQPEHC